jgi:hypothetical protein
MVTSATLRLEPADLAVIAARVPHQEALRHKRRGVWFSWSWSDLVTNSDRLAKALLARGIGAGTLVAVSGDYGPNVVLFATAAARVGARVATLPTGITRAALADWLTRESPDLVFLGQRDQLGLWRAALQKAGRQAALVVDFHLPWGHPSAAGYTFAADLLGDAAGGTVARRLTSDVLWIEESTDWPDGLSCILHAAIASGRSLAFPESRAAAARDRREVQPVSIMLSRAHRAALAQHLASRLPTGGSLAARLTRNALAAGQAGHAHWPQRWLLRRLRRPFGLASLRDLTVVAGDGDAPQAASDLFTAFGIREGYALPPTATPLPARAGLAFA